ncbi:MAG: putative sulfate exporter family transporter [Pseudomonadota bacterium]
MKSGAANWVATRGAGLGLSLLVAVVATLAQKALGGATMVYALLLGIALHAAGRTPRFAPGVEFCARQVLRFGVALLGLRITLGDIAVLGWSVALIAIGAVVLTLTGGYAIARACRLAPPFAMVTAGAVAICGASAALAVAAVLPQGETAERRTLLTIVGVTSLSTVAMVAYPIIADLLQFNDQTAGVFLGASIHDVAQVVGAGYTVSNAAGETATLVKLMRVACLVPAVLVIAWLFRDPSTETGKTPGLPTFLIGFVVLMLINSSGLVPDTIVAPFVTLAGQLLVLAVAALGLKTSLRGLASLGVMPLAAMLGQTLMLGVAVAGVLLLISG